MNEAGHAKNVANFASYISIVNTLGAAYDPPVAQIEVNALQFRRTAFEAAINAVTPKASAETLALNDRQSVFESLSPLVTRIANAAAVSVNDQLFSNDLRTVARKLQGRRATPKQKDDPSTPDVDESKLGGSSSQMSFDSRIEHFGELLDLLEQSGSYNPNESELQLTTLKALLDDMKAKNSSAVNAVNQARAARIARDEILYNDTDGIIALANLIKKYVKSLHGAQSPQYKQLTALKFRKP